MNFTVCVALGALSLSLLDLIVHDIDLQTGGTVKDTYGVGFWSPPVCQGNTLLFRQKTYLTRGQSLPKSRWGQPGEEGYVGPIRALPCLVFSYAVGL